MTLINLSSRSRKPIAESEILLAGPVRNASNHIANDIEKVLTSLGQFKAVYCFIVESDSSDDTLQRLEEMSKKFKNFSFITAGQLSKKLPKRTDRIAYARNLIIDAVASDPKYQNIDYVAMADLDGMNGLVTQEKITQCWEVDEPWDVITANQLGGYYDIWALSHPHWNPMDCWEQKHRLEVILGDKAATEIALGCKQVVIDPRADLIEVDSAFGGLGIYKREAFLAGRYAGTDSEAGGIDVADHTPFHRELRQKGFRIFINPALINCNKASGSDEPVVLPKPRGAVKLIKKLGILIFGKKRFNKYLQLMHTP
ncbi:glycosyltransferase family 2 protein [Polynucleobacter sp. MWH-Adler-W8]|uniref:glycosyltransferase family 2 protein n=1 Tax=Polynucleobacter sp. MWH-Adler-W8 TaxID=1819727 RepID=UPI000A6A7D8E|nr:glycosyltransferase family 2 protein [Polynucleobacter sp. MWH-Adler-W8]